jgi:NTE family protein
MNFQLRPHFSTADRRLPFDYIALLLQGGGALGAYQGGVYEALAEANIHPDWVAGISIGAINAAIIAGNPPESRVDRLREFWTQVTSTGFWDWSANPFLDLARGDDTRNLLNQMSANLAAAFGAAGFFSARPLMPWLQPGGTLGATSFYDTEHLKRTLERLVDFARLNAGMTRFSAGAVNIRTGNFVYFDTTTHKITPEHVMASGALPPGFPAVEIDGEHYWDGGLVSNTPLQWVIESNPRRQDTLAFQVDLWSSQGALPRNIRKSQHVTRRFSFQAARARAPASSRTCIGSSVPLPPCYAGSPPILRRTMIWKSSNRWPATRSTTSST